jgi:hypothetical protein
MSWTDPVGDLRTLLSDGVSDKLSAGKKVFGGQNGTNVTFKTFEFRRTTDFSSSALASPFGVSINGTLLPSTAVIADDLATGFYTLASAYAPSTTAIMTTTYYYQWFLDSELVSFLRLASNWLGQGDDYTITPDGLKTALLKYAMHEAYSKVALKYSIDLSATYRLEDQKDSKATDFVKVYKGFAETELKEAKQYRDDYYTRKGQALAPLFRSVRGNIKTPTIS